MFAALLQKLGIADEINKKAVLGKGGHDVAVLIAEGRAEIGTTFISEVLPVKGVKIVGPLPGELHNANTYTAAIHTRAASPEARHGPAAQADQRDDPPALDGGRPGARFSRALTILHGRAGLPNYAWKGVRRHGRS